MNNYSVSANSIHIDESWNISKYDFDKILDEIVKSHPDNQVLLNRKRWHIKLEWAVHNALYKFHIFPSHTKEVDINYPQKWYIKVIYVIAGLPAWLVIS